MNLKTKYYIYIKRLSSMNIIKYYILYLKSIINVLIYNSDFLFFLLQTLFNSILDIYI